MSRFKERSNTVTKGFIPRVLDFESDPLMEPVFNATVEYGTGCWVELGSPEDFMTTQQVVWEHFHGEPFPEDRWIYNSCSDYKVCYNPNCLEIAELIYEDEHP